MAGKARRATPSQIEEMNRILSASEIDVEGTAARISALGSGCFLPGDPPDDACSAAIKVDFSVLDQELPSFEMFDDDVLTQLPEDALREHCLSLQAAAEAYSMYCRKVTEQLANAWELIQWYANRSFGQSSQRSASIFKNDEETAEQTAAAESTETKPQDLPKEEMPKKPERNSENRPRRRKGCADKVCEGAASVEQHHELTGEQLDELFGKENWVEIENGAVVKKEYRIVPAQILVVAHILHKYRVKKPAVGVPTIVTAPAPFARLREKSRMTSGLMGNIMYWRNTMRIPVDRVSGMLQDMNLQITPQCVNENMRYYAGFFHALLQRMWTHLLLTHHIQVDETPLRIYDSSTGQTKRYYVWVFTVSEMLGAEKQITLFHLADSRSADVLRECLQGYTGTIGSDGHSAYHVFARESNGMVTNAGCLNHFRDRVIKAVKVIPGVSTMSVEERMSYPACIIMSRLNEIFLEEREVKKLGGKEEREARRNKVVRGMFNELSRSVENASRNPVSSGSYLADAIKYFRNQEVYLSEFLDDGDICANNSICERHIAFFSVLRNQIKMFGSSKGAEAAVILESIEQTARPYVKNMRIYYQFLLEALVPLVRSMPHGTDFSTMVEMDEYLPWSERYQKYEGEHLTAERSLLESIYKP